MNQHQRDILDAHLQHRRYSCFQMAPELALKLGSILHVDESPFQCHHCWDRKGFEPYSVHHVVGGYKVIFHTDTFYYPYSGMAQVLREELHKGHFPVVSLQPKGSSNWHGYVILEESGADDFIVVTKKGCVEDPPCESDEDRLNVRISNQQKVDCLFWDTQPLAPPHI